MSDPQTEARRIRVLELPQGGWVRASEIAGIEAQHPPTLSVWLRGGCFLGLTFDTAEQAQSWMEAARP